MVCLYSVALDTLLSFLHTEGTESGSTLSSKIETCELEFLTVARIVVVLVVNGNAEVKSSMAISTLGFFVFLTCHATPLALNKMFFLPKSRVSSLKETKLI